MLEYNGDVSQGSKEHRFGLGCNFCPLVFPSGRQEISLSFGLATQLVYSELYLTWVLYPNLSMC